MEQNVLIVGAGPTGLTAALELARFGIPVRLIEKREQPETTSRAIGVQARTLELMEQRGLADRFVSAGHIATGGSIYDDGKRIVRLDLSRIESSYPYLLMLSQAETERILREAIERSGVTVGWGVELVALAQREQGDSVSAVLRDKDGGLENCEFAWLISSEGAHSLVRTTLGLQFEGKALDHEYALGDLFVDGEVPESDFHIFSSKFGFMALFPLGGRRFRLIASDPPGKSDKIRADENTPPSLPELQEIYDQRSAIAAHFRDLSWSSWFRINSRMVHCLREGRVLLGGDSAHIHSPAGGQGMNTGIQDMIDLCWKLAFVIQGKAQNRLLDTYAEDRLPVMRHVLQRTEELTDAIGSENALVRSLFDHVAPWLGSKVFAQDTAAAQISQIALNYRESSLSVNDGHEGALRAGDRLPDREVMVQEPNEPHAARLFELMDPSRFTLFCRNLSDHAKTQAEIEEKLRAWLGFIDICQITTEGDPPAILFVRPDSYIGFIGSEKSVTALARYCSEWFC